MALTLCISDPLIRDEGDISNVMKLISCFNLNIYILILLLNLVFDFVQLNVALQQVDALCWQRLQHIVITDMQRAYICLIDGDILTHMISLLMLSVQA